MGSLFSLNRGVKYLLFVIYGFIEIVNESKCQPNKFWVDQGKEFIIMLCKNV